MTTRDATMQIGDVARAADVSVPVVRKYDQAGLLCPTSRSEGGFRLYSEADLQRLHLLRQMRLLGFSAEEMHELLALLENSAPTSSTAPTSFLHPDEHQALAVLEQYTARAKTTERQLKARLRSAHELITKLEDAVRTRTSHGHTRPSQ